MKRVSISVPRRVTNYANTSSMPEINDTRRVTHYALDDTRYKLSFLNNEGNVIKRIITIPQPSEERLSMNVPN